MTFFRERRWEKELQCDGKSERSTRFVHRDLDSKAGVKFEWLITQDYGKNEVKLTDEQLAEIVAWYRAWKGEDA